MHRSSQGTLRLLDHIAEPALEIPRLGDRDSLHLRRQLQLLHIPLRQLRIRIFHPRQLLVLPLQQRFECKCAQQRDNLQCDAAADGRAVERGVLGAVGKRGPDRGGVTD